jgi:tetratricopeptide (TPR) repeat protein
MEEELYLEIERYLSNDMSADERSLFETKLKSDSAFAEKVNLYRSASERLAARFKGEEKERLFRKTLATMEIAAPSESKTKAIQFYGWAAAASIALLCVALFYTSSLKPDYADYANYEPLTLVERGDDNTIKLQAQLDFNAKEYEKAIANLDELIQADPQNVELKLYKGIALLEVDQVKEANVLFEAVRNSNSVYKDRGTWMLALSALKQKDYEQCEALLKEIPNDSPEYPTAQNLLNKL